MTHRRRRTWVGTAIGSAALAVATLLAVQGCAPAAPAQAASPAHYGLTRAQAEAAYSSYLAASDAAAAAGNQTLGLTIVADAQWSQVRGQYTTLASTGTAVPRYRYGTPVYYVPTLTGYPRWFMVAVPRSPGPGAHPGGAVKTIMVFERRAADLPWRLNGTAVLGKALPAIARDRDGYAIDVPSTDPSLLLRPDVVGATQAAVVDDGPGSVAAAVIGGGPQTTGLYAAQAALASSAQAGGVHYRWLLQGAPFPQFGLRTADGGALVLYGMFLNTTTEHANLAAGSPIPVPAGFSPLLAAPTEIGYHAVYANWTYQYAAVDPPLTAHHAKIDVIAAYGAPSYGHAY